LAARPIVAGGTIRGAYVESKMGHETVLAKVVVDTTGEADLAWQAGCPMRQRTLLNQGAYLESGKRLARLGLDVD
jgi:hypothetical protein